MRDTIGRMAYDPALADRIRRLLADEDGLTEKKMFGGIGWMLGGHMAAGASSTGNLIVRADKEASLRYAEEPGASLMVQRGRGMAGWVMVQAAAVADDDALATWVSRGRAYAAGLPPKA
jgi:TfoX/Sxy family transcriptional regulator of competence genes